MNGVSVSRRAARWLATFSAVAFCGCADHTHAGEVPFYQFALTEATPAFYVGVEESFFLVEERVEFSIDPPTSEEMAELNAEAPAPYPRRPWVERGDYGIEVDWALINLDDQEHRVIVSINGINEFHEYVPAVQEIDDAIVPDFAQWERSIELGPLERRSGTVREAQLEEAAVDLATVVNGAPNGNQIVHPENHSANDERSQLYIPEVIPALVGVRAGLGMTGEVAGNVVLELTVRLRDEDDKIVEFEDAWELPTPAPFTPVPLEI